MRSTLIVAALALGAAAAQAQQPQPQPQQPAPTPAPLDSGATAPDFALPGSTGGQLLNHPVRLSDYRGKTVVVSFFYKSRTRG